MTMHCPACEVGWIGTYLDRCWNCHQFGTPGYGNTKCIPTATQRTTTEACGSPPG